MNRRLAVLAVAALAAVGAAVPASAKTLCLQIQDPSGDGAILGAVPQAEDALDILSGDIATGRRNLVAALRVKSLSASTPVGGRSYAFDFTVGGVAYQLTHTVNLDGTTRGALKAGGTTAEAVTAVVDTSSGTITWTIPRKSIPGLKKTGGKITGLGGAAYYAVAQQVPGGTYDFATPSDTASTGRSYTDGAATCLRGT